MLGALGSSGKKDIDIGLAPVGLTTSSKSTLSPALTEFGKLALERFPVFLENPADIHELIKVNLSDTCQGAWER